MNLIGLVKAGNVFETFPAFDICYYMAPFINSMPYLMGTPKEIIP